MATELSLTIDAATVLGVPRNATLAEIRDAYRAQAKRYHPDAGGEDWVFRIISQSYEILCSSRVAFATERENSSPFRPSAPPREPNPTASAPHPETPPADPWDDTPSSNDVWESNADPSVRVDVERLSVRHEVGHIWLITDRTSGQQVFSCSLHVTWPDPAWTTRPAVIEDAKAILGDLREVLDTLHVQSRALDISISASDDLFSAWVSYPNVACAAAASTLLRTLLQSRGLLVRFHARDLVIPRA